MMDPAKIAMLLLRRFPYEPTAGQRQLMDLLGDFLSKKDPKSVFLLKGYAGTGKTTIVSSLVRILPLLGLQTVLLAPTGRAAKVLANYSDHKAYTIHKKIYRPRTAQDGSIQLHLIENTHYNTLFVVDEASMVPDNTTSREASLFSGRSLLEDLFHYVFSGDDCFLLLLGDTAQLPPVGSLLSPALDLQFMKRNFPVNIAQFELTEVVRQELESGILSNATSLRNKISRGEESPPFFDLRAFNDIKRINGGELEELLNYLISRTNVDNTVVITRSNKRANLFNKGIRNNILFREEEISAGDYLMVVKNNYFWLPDESRAGFIANGDLMEVIRIVKHTSLFGFHFAEATVRLVDYPEENDLSVTLLLDTLHSESPSLTFREHSLLFNNIMEDYMDIGSKRKRIEKVKSNPYYNALQVKFAYSLTCHKTQGGQWENVIVDQGYLKDDTTDLEYLRWLYTAVTRATKRLYLLNFSDSFFS